MKPNSVILVATEGDMFSSVHLTDKSSKLFLPSVRLPIYSIYLTFAYLGSGCSHVFYEGSVLKNCTKFTEKKLCCSLFLTESPGNKFVQ